MPRCIRHIFSLILFSCFAVSFCFGQSSAAFSGKVIDPSQAIVRGAAVRIVNQATGVERKTTTNSDGRYQVPFLSPGIYQVFIQAHGFSTAASNPLTVDVGQAVVFDVQLHLGNVQDTVTVESGSPLIDVTDAAVGTVISRKFVENIPLNGRSFQDLISMTPGVVTQSPQNSLGLGYVGDFSVNGQRTESNVYLVDGVLANTNPGNGTSGSGGNGTLGASTALGTTQSLVSVDALEEFRVQSSTYSPEYGIGPGGQFSFISRSGANTVHGDAYDYLRNGFFDANDWFNDHYNIHPSALRQNDFGGAISGPVFLPRLYNGKDRFFFFAAYEGLRLTQPKAASVMYVPDTAIRSAAAAVLQPMLNAFPQPTPGGTDYGFLAQFIQNYSVPARIDSTSVRVDYTLSEKLNLFYRLAPTYSSAQSRNLSLLSNLQSDSFAHTIGATSQFSKQLNNEFRVGYVLSHATLSSTTDSFGGAQASSLAADIGVGSYPNAGPVVVLIQSGAGSSVLNELPTTNRLHQLNIVDNVSLQRGKHLFKFGVNFRRIATPLIHDDPLVEPEYTSAAQLKANAAVLLYTSRNANATPLFHDTSLFAQDEWHISSPLTLSYGVRWELYPPPVEAHGNDAYTLLGSIQNPSTLSLAPRGTPLWSTTYYNFAPRIGAAWVAHSDPGHETVIRSGFGVFFDSNNESATQGYASGIGFNAYKSYTGAAAALPVTTAQLAYTTAVTAPYTSQIAYVFPGHLQLPYTLEWNGSLQQGLGRRQSLTISYVGSNGRRLTNELKTSITAYNPNFGTVIYYPTSTTSNYNALQAEFQRQVGHGLQALGSYTWAHSIDFGSTYYTKPVIRGNSDFDVRNSFQAGLSWDIFAPKSNAFVDALTHGWGLDGRLIIRGAFPILLAGSTIVDPTTGSTYSGNVNINPSQPFYLYGNYPGGRELNKAAFSTPAANQTGNAPRNFLRGFGENQVNLSARRNFPIYRECQLQFRAEAFNILNHPVFGYVDPTLTDATFGQATKTLAQSLTTLASQYQQGGPRSMQFALKLAF